MNCRRAILLAATILGALVTGCESTEKAEETTTAAAAPATAGPLTVEDSFEVDVTARVKAIDHAYRVVTLQDEAGEEVTFLADDSVTRLHEVKAGDNVRARYRARLVAELRPPTAEEAANPIAVVGVGGRSPQGAAPAGGVAQVVRVVTTVEAVDVPNMRVTLRGPMGDLAVVRGRSAENLQRLRVGDTIVITFTESVAIALEKLASR